MGWCSRLAALILANAMLIGTPTHADAAVGRTVYLTPVGNGAIRMQVNARTRWDPDAGPKTFDGWVSPGQTIAVYDDARCFWYRHTYGVLRRVNWSDWMSVCQPSSRFIPAKDIRVLVPTDRP